MKEELVNKIDVLHLRDWKSNLIEMKNDCEKKERYDYSERIQKQIDILDHYISEDNDDIA